VAGDRRAPATDTVVPSIAGSAPTTPPLGVDSARAVMVGAFQKNATSTQPSLSAAPTTAMTRVGAQAAQRRRGRARVGGRVALRGSACAPGGGRRAPRAPRRATADGATVAPSSPAAGSRGLGLFHWQAAPRPDEARDPAPRLIRGAVLGARGAGADRGRGRSGRRHAARRAERRLREGGPRAAHQVVCGLVVAPPAPITEATCPHGPVACDGRDGSAGSAGSAEALPGTTKRAHRPPPVFFS
jgi:hypothetical protein